MTRQAIETILGRRSAKGAFLAVLMVFALSCNLMLGSTWAYADDATPAEGAEEPRANTSEDSPSPTVPEEDSGAAPAASATLRATLTSMDSGTHEAFATSDASLSCNLTYAGLVPGQSYAAAVTVCEPVPPKEGAEASDGSAMPAAEATFVPEAEEGSIAIEVPCDASRFAGMTVTARCAVYDSEGTIVCSYENPDDDETAVRFPRISSTTVETQSKRQGMSPQADGIILDRVSYENLTPGNPYEIEAQLYPCEVEEGSSETEGLVPGESLSTARLSFTPEASEGTVEISLPLDATATSAPTVVATERLSHNGHVLASHEDLGDSRSTISLVGISTTLTDHADGDHQAVLPTPHLDDTITYQGLVPGATYKVVGTLHVRKADGSDGGCVRGPDGSALVVTQTFTPEAGTGSIVQSFDLGASVADGVTLVAFESLYRDETCLAVHEDIDSESQRVVIASVDAPMQSGSPTGSKMPQTGRLPLGKLLVGAGAVTFAIGATAWLLIRRERATGSHSYRRRHHYMA